MKLGPGRIVLVLLILLAAAMPVMGQTLTDLGATSIAPTIIPIQAGGASGIGIIMQDLGFTGTPYIGRIELTNDDGSAVNTLITNVRAFVDDSSPVKFHADNIANHSGEITFSAIEYDTDITGASVNGKIRLTVSDATGLVTGTPAATVLWIALDFAAAWPTPDAVFGMEISAIQWGASAGATTNTLNPATHGGTTAINNYFVNYRTSGIIVNANEEEGTAGVQLMSFDLGWPGTPDVFNENVSHELGTVTLTYLGESTADIIAGGVKLHRDGNGNGVFDDDVTDPQVANASPGATVLLTTNPLELVNNTFTTDATFLVVVDIANRSGVGVGNTVGFQIDNSLGSVLTFRDEVLDAGANIVGEYPQVGYITDTSTGPTVNHTIIVDPETVIDTTPPTIIASNPSDATAGVSRNLATIALTFDDVMFDDSGAGDPGSVTTLANYSMTGPTTVTLSGVTFNSGNRTATLTVDSGSLPLQYLGDYTVTVVNVENTDGYGMISDSISFTIEAESPPTVLGTIPADGSTDAAIGTSVGIIFSEAMDEATITNEANFSLLAEGAAEEVPGAMTYTASGNTATFTPDAPLTFSTSYTATATTGVTDAEGSPLAADHTFSFTTASAAGSLSFTDIIVANNRIEPGSTDPMRIFIETPEGLNATDVVTIGVYTSTGRRVATLTTAGETYADVIARQPILWDGTNGRGQPLGPGLYFVQVSSAEYRRALRVMIVR